MKLKSFLFVALSPLVLMADNWPSVMGPKGDYQVEGEIPLKWSAVRNENILWRTPMPEAGQAAVIVWGDKLFTTIHKPIENVDQKSEVKDIIALCLDANSGEILWQKDIPGQVTIELANGFSDGTVFSPICDGERVWFFNRCGQMACFDLDGNEIWRRDFKPRYMHTNRQAEPQIVGDSILYVEMADKRDEFVNLRKKTPGAEAAKKKFSEDKGFWTYVHGIDKNTGKFLWKEDKGITVHNTPIVSTLADGSPAIVILRGGPHKPVERPAGASLISLKKGEEGKEIWAKEFNYFVMNNNHWNSEFIPLFTAKDHITLNSKDGSEFKKVSLIEGAMLHKKGQASVAMKVVGKKNRTSTYSTNILVGDEHYFLTFSMPYLGKVNIRTGKVEYLELPAQLIPGKTSAAEDKYLVNIKEVKNAPINQKGLAVGFKGHNGAGFGHMHSASPIRVGKYLIFPVVTGTVYVIDTTKSFENGEALVAVNDLGEAGKTWTLSSFSYSNGKLYAHTMKEIICIAK